MKGCEAVTVMSTTTLCLRLFLRILKLPLWVVLRNSSKLKEPVFEKEFFHFVQTVAPERLQMSRDLSKCSQMLKVI